MNTHFEKETQREIVEFLENLGPLRLGPEDVRRIKEAKKVIRNQRKRERVQRTQ